MHRPHFSYSKTILFERAQRVENLLNVELYGVIARSTSLSLSTGSATRQSQRNMIQNLAENIEALKDIIPTSCDKSVTGALLFYVDIYEYPNTI